LNRTELQLLSENRARDAETLLNLGQWSGAYYLVGYAVECRLKACIAKQTNQHDFPDKKHADRCFTHDLEALLQVSGLVPQRTLDAQRNPVLGNNWLIVKDWNERARYQLWSENQARKLYEAVTNANDGVLSWIKAHW
jgi:HEPN domain-containing protein